MIVVYAGESPPETFTKSVFLAGPTPRTNEVLSWRPEALRLLEAEGYDGVVFVPEARTGVSRPSYTDQVEWEQRHLNMSDRILFWVPRDMATMPALTTNVEFGMWYRSGKVVFGAPESAVHVSYLKHCAAGEWVPLATTLEDTVANAIAGLGEGAERVGGERDVPLLVWRTPSFQAWYRTLTAAGNRLDGARVDWTFRVGPTKGFMLFWALHANIYVATEGRHKSNEVVISRPDISSVVMYQRYPILEESVVVLVREFRSPGRTGDGYVRENAGGSSFKPGKNPLQLASEECEQETGLSISLERFQVVGARQVAGTVSAHMAHVFAVELTDEEVARLRSEASCVRGVAAETERTYVEVRTVGELVRKPLTDWSTLGMVLSVLTRERNQDAQ